MKQTKLTVIPNESSYLGKKFFVGSTMLMCNKVYILHSGEVIIGAENMTFKLKVCDFVAIIIE